MRGLRVEKTVYNAPLGLLVTLEDGGDSRRSSDYSQFAVESTLVEVNGRDRGVP
jgi:hypothetical protein